MLSFLSLVCAHAHMNSLLFFYPNSVIIILFMYSLLSSLFILVFSLFLNDSPQSLTKDSGEESDNESSSSQLLGTDFPLASVKTGTNHASGMKEERSQDEEFARTLQEQLNHGETETSSAHCESTASVLKPNELEPADTSSEDENLMLKLTPSLARQLQNMFGSISEHLPHKGTVYFEVFAGTIILSR